MAEDGTYCRECGRPWEDEDALDAQRYRKMRAAFEKAEESDFPMHETETLTARLSVDFDGTVDALDPNENSNRSR